MANCKNNNRISAISPVDFLPITHLWESKLTKLAVLQTYWHSGAPPGATKNPGPAFKTQASIQGASCASYIGDVVLGFKPYASAKEPVWLL